MTGLALTVGALITAIVAAGWAGMLALAEESPDVSSRGAPPGSGGAPVPLHRALQVSRLALVILAGVAASQAVGWWYRPALEGLGIVLVTAGFLFMIADVIPRAVGQLAPDAAAAALAVARGTVLPFRPLLGLVSGAERLAQRLVRRPAGTEGSPPLPPTHRDMLLGVFALSDTTVAEVMTPRLDIAAVESRASWPEVLELVRQSEHARVPVYQDTPDNVLGILHARDLVPAVGGAAPAPDRWQDLIRPADFVPESKSLAAQLRDFQRGPGHLAIVVDEFGGTSGLITLEDVLEEIVGEIRDEYDVDEKPPVEREGNDRFWVDGSATLDELSAALGTPFDREDVATVGGLIYSELGRVPDPGQDLQIGKFRVVVEQVVRRRIRRVYFERLHSAPKAPVAAEGPE